jgi:RNA polymerase sigma-70 factor (ECF subfamily)
MDGTPARGAVVTAYARSLIRYKAQQLSRKRGYGPSDREDLEQELLLHLLERAHLYDPKRGAASTFADRVIQNAGRMILRHRRRQKRGAGRTPRSLDESVAGADQNPPRREQLTIHDLERRTANSTRDLVHDSEVRGAVSIALDRMPGHLLDVCLRLMQGSPASVARDLGVCRRRLRNLMGEIERYLRDAGLGES